MCLMYQKTRFKFCLGIIRIYDVRLSLKEVMKVAKLLTYLIIQELNTLYLTQSLQCLFVLELTS